MATPGLRRFYLDNDDPDQLKIHSKQEVIDILIQFSNRVHAKAVLESYAQHKLSVNNKVNLSNKLHLIEQELIANNAPDYAVEFTTLRWNLSLRPSRVYEHPPNLHLDPVVRSSSPMSSSHSSQNVSFIEREAFNDMVPNFLNGSSSCSTPSLSSFLPRPTRTISTAPASKELSPPKKVGKSKRSLSRDRPFWMTAVEQAHKSNRDDSNSCANSISGFSMISMDSWEEESRALTQTKQHVQLEEASERQYVESIGSGGESYTGGRGDSYQVAVGREWDRQWLEKNAPDDLKLKR